MPDKINLDSSGLRRSVRSEVLSRREKVYSHSTTVLKSVKRSSKHACLVLFSSFCAIGAALDGGVHSHQVLSQSSSLLSNAIDSYHRVRGIASTQMRGLCHGKKSERAGCIASAQMSSKELLEANANLQTTNDFRRGSPSHFNVGRLHELIVGPAWNPTFNRTTPSLSFKYIVESISVGARFAPTTFRAFKFIVALLTSFADFQLVVEFNVNPHSEGECNASIIFGDKAALLKSDGAQSAPNSLFNDDSKFIVVSSFFNQFQRYIHRVDCYFNVWTIKPIPSQR
jgi:hypothetical protein